MIIKILLFIIYTVFVFRIGREYQIAKTIEYIENSLRKHGIDPDNIGEDNE